MSTAIPGPSGIFLRIKYEPDTINKILDYAAQQGPGAQGGAPGIPTGLADTAIYAFVSARADRKDFGGYFYSRSRTGSMIVHKLRDLIMTPPPRNADRLCRVALAAGLLASFVLASEGRSADGVPAGPRVCPTCHKVPTRAEPPNTSGRRASRGSAWATTSAMATGVTAWASARDGGYPFSTAAPVIRTRPLG